MPECLTFTTDLTHPCLANERELNDRAFTIRCEFARTSVSNSNFICIKQPGLDKCFWNIASIYRNCWPNPWHHLYHHLLRPTDFASLVPLFKNHQYIVMSPQSTFMEHMQFNQIYSINKFKVKLLGYWLEKTTKRSSFILLARIYSCR
jgi:hypothetical protein